jgi:hypothetical protein
MKFNEEIVTIGSYEKAPLIEMAEGRMAQKAIISLAKGAFFTAL